MRILILAVGRLENSEYKAVFEEYLKRIKWKVELKEFDVKKSNNFSTEKIQKEEGKLILNAIEQNSKSSPIVVALDENGKQFSSKDFSKVISDFTLNGNSNFVFVVGGASGLAAEVLSIAKLKLSLGKMTFPHLMARVILIEQIYRCETIVSGHPYHK
jgi:23S rRNA (pseudouridine1915-N3)-methyltransferase